jgi:flagellar FliJ protein
MKFKFKLEKVLQHKHILEKQAQRDFSEMQKKLDEQLNLLKSLEDSLKNTYNERQTIILAGGSVSANLDFVQKAYDGYRYMIENQKKIIIGLEKIVEEKRLRLVEATKDRKVFEKLKEKKKDEFIKDKKRKDQKTTDEINGMLANQRGRE